MSTRNTPHYDVVIAGARCAGAATALLLARQGAGVLLLDRSRFGRGISLRCWARQRVAQTMSAAVRTDRRLETRGHGHIADSVAADDTVRRSSRRSETLWRCRKELRQRAPQI